MVADYIARQFQSESAELFPSPQFALSTSFNSPRGGLDPL